MVARNIDNTGGVSQAAMSPLVPAAPADHRPGKPPIGTANVKDDGGSLSPVSTQAAANATTPAPAIDFKKIDDALRGQGDRDLATEIYSQMKCPDDPDNLPRNFSSFPQDLKRHEVKAQEIIDHYQNSKNSGKITPNQFAKIRDEVYNNLGSGLN
jgi:hypothetical protein